MKESEKLQSRFPEVYQPTFYWGAGALEAALIVYTLYMEFVTGTGPSLISTVLPLSVFILVVWAVVAVLITLAIIGFENRAKHK